MLQKTKSGGDVKEDVAREVSNAELNYYANLYLSLNGSWSKTPFVVFLNKMMRRKRCALEHIYGRVD